MLRVPCNSVFVLPLPQRIPIGSQGSRTSCNSWKITLPRRSGRSVSTSDRTSRATPTTCSSPTTPAATRAASPPSDVAAVNRSSAWATTSTASPVMSFIFWCMLLVSSMSWFDLDSDVYRVTGRMALKFEIWTMAFKSDMRSYAISYCDSKNKEVFSVLFKFHPSEFLDICHFSWSYILANFNFDDVVNHENVDPRS